MRRTCRRFRSCSESHGLAGPLEARRVLTSANTSVVPSQTIRSISPWRVRWLRVDEREAEPAVVLEGELLAGAAELLARIGGHRRRP